MTSEWNPERSLFPDGAGAPFSWTGVEETLGALSARVDRVFASPLLPETLASLRDWFRTHHVFHSNAIEGSTLTLYETQVIIGDGLTVGGKPLRDVLAARNLAHALDWMEEQAKTAGAISERIVRELHALALQGEDRALPGRYKTENNLVSGAQFRTPPAVQTEALMNALGNYLAGPMEGDPILSSCVVHAWLVGIHPFRDGNGRTARLLSNLVLLRKGYPIALVTLDRRPEYYAALDEAHCTGDLSRFVLLWCDFVSATLDEYERLGGTMQVREREVQYFAGVINQQRARADVDVERWRMSIASLTSQLQAIARTMNSTLVDGARITVDAIPVVPEILADASAGHAPSVIRVKGMMPERSFEAGVTLNRWRGKPGLWLGLVRSTGTSEFDLNELLIEGNRFTLRWRVHEQVSVSAAEAANAIMREFLIHAADLPAPEHARE